MASVNYQRDLRARRAAAGLCRWCGKVAEVGTLCPKCKLQARDAHRKARKRREKPMDPWRNPQQRWREHMRAEGRCVKCGQPRDCESPSVCRRCLFRMRETNRLRAGCKAKVKGGPGRPPMEG